MAKSKVTRILSRDRGFTLVEVMIATGIFAVFVAAYMIAQGFNISDSAQFAEELRLRSLAEMKINEIVLDPPEFSDSLTMTRETKSFENEERYSYTLEWRKFILPDLTKIKGEEGGADDPVKMVEAKLFEKIKENMEKMVWQLEVTIKNKSTGENYTVSTWLYNGDAELTTDTL